MGSLHDVSTIARYESPDMHQSLVRLIAVVGLLVALMAATAPSLLKHTRIGLEFRGGYEMVFVAMPLAPKTTVDRADLLAAAGIVAKRANGLGVSEPKIDVEGQSIRVKLAGVNNGDALRRTLLDPRGLPVKLTERYSQTVGGVLGAADFTATLNAGLYALGAIALFMLVVYRVPGLVAVFTLCVYLWLLLVAFNALHATLSLAAIVAFILGVGIAADANILSFERIKESLRAGVPPLQAIREGERRALGTILNANAAVFLCVIVLFFAGVGPVRGFALTTALGIVISILTNVYLARFLIGSLTTANPRLAEHMFTVRPQTGRRPFGFVRVRAFSLAAAAVVAAICVWGTMTSAINYDIDFKAGTALDVQLPRGSTQDKATDIIASAGTAAATVSVGGTDGRQVAARFDNVLDAKQINKTVDAFKKEYGTGVAFQENTADPIVAEQLRRESIVAIAVAIAVTFVFLALRFGWRFAVAAMTATLSAALFVLGVFAIAHLEIDVTFIAAILTVIGFTLNETVPILDRVRENARAGTGSIDASVAQTVVRSVYTVLMVIIGAVSLYQFGAEPLHNFALAILLGLIYGTLAALFIAPQLWSLLGGSGRERSVQRAFG